MPLVPQAFMTLFGAEAAGIANPVNPLLEPYQLAVAVGVPDAVRRAVALTVAVRVGGAVRLGDRAGRPCVLRSPEVVFAKRLPRAESLRMEAMLWILRARGQRGDEGVLHLHGLQHHDGLALGDGVAGFGGGGDDLARHGRAEGTVGGGAAGSRPAPGEGAHLEG
jgi:hypothetical protein